MKASRWLHGTLKLFDYSSTNSACQTLMCIHTAMNIVRCMVSYDTLESSEPYRFCLLAAGYNKFEGMLTAGTYQLQETEAIAIPTVCTYA